MNTVEKMLSGEIEMKEFVSALRSDPEVREYVRELVPAEARNNPECKIWYRYDYQGIKSRGFDLLKQINFICRCGGSMGKELNIFSTIARFYCYSHPDFKCTTKYEDEFNLYIEACGETYDGSEVMDYIKKILDEVLATVQGKTNRKKEAKRRIVEGFHAADKKRPYWIQGGEWPMGKNSPMKFLDRKKRGECTLYIFEDVDTGEQRVVEQFY